MNDSISEFKAGISARLAIGIIMCIATLRLME